MVCVVPTPLQSFGLLCGDVGWWSVADRACCELVEGKVQLNRAAEGPGVKTAVVLDVAAGFERAVGSRFGLVAVVGGFFELAGGEAAAGEEQDPEDAGGGACEIADEVGLLFEGHGELRCGFTHPPAPSQIGWGR